VTAPHTRAARFPGLDAVRAIGATAVVATHCGFWTARSLHGPFSTVLARMDIGVALFFVLSGFLLFRPFVVAHERGSAWPSTGTYLLRRALRILPAYWLVVAVALVTIGENAQLNGPVWWLRDLTLTHIYGLDWGRAQGLTQTWSLATEVVFYLALPLLAHLVLRVARRPVVALALVMAVAPLWYSYIVQVGGPDSRVAAQWLPGYLDWFGAGMLLALLEVRARTSVPTGWSARLHELALSPSTCWGGALALLAVATTTVAGPQDLTTLTGPELVVKNLLYAALAFLVVLPLTLGTGGSLDRALDTRVVHWVGEISYGIFLWHLVVLQAVTSRRDQQLFTGSWPVTFALVWGTSVLVASASYVLLERPLLRLKDTLRGTSPSSTDQVAASPVTQSA
jgi:peptidoglycan/LPS O-acetylase OafA/YrhL